MTRFENAYGLVIGVGDYTAQPTPTRAGFASLPVTVRDAQSIAAILVDPARCCYDPNHVELIAGSDATSAKIRSALQDVSSITDSKSTVFVFFSGHGGRAIVNGSWRAYLCPREADPDDLNGTAISGEEFSDLLVAIPARKLLVVLDTCHSGGAAELKAQREITTWKAGLPEVYVQALSYGSGRVVIASSKEDQVSYVRAQQDLSLFTYHLVRGLNGYAAVRDDGFIHVLDLFHYVNSAVRADEPEQVPILKVKDLDLNFPVALDRAGKGAGGNNKGQIAAIRQQIVRDPIKGAMSLSQYLETCQEWAEKRNDVDLKRAEFQQVKRDMNLFGPNENDRAVMNRIIYYLLHVCLELEQSES